MSYTPIGLPSPKKVARIAAVVALALLVFALSYSAKRGLFDAPGHHGQFLSKSVKMENLGDVHAAAIHFEPTFEVLQPERLHLDILFTIPPAGPVEAPVFSLSSLAPPLLV